MIPRNNEPAISFLVCTRNREEIVQSCVLNLLSRGSDIEVVVRDNCSTDNTVETLRKIDDPRLKIYVAPENQGTFSFFEIAKLASGKIVTWLSDEDDFQFEHLDYIFSKFADPACTVMFGSILVGAGRQLMFRDETTDDPVRAALTALSFSGCGGVFIRRSSLSDVNSLNVSNANDSYILWNNYPIGFFASRCINHLLVSTSKIVVKQTRFAQTTNNWNAALGYNPRLPHYYPETVFDRLSSNIANVYNSKKSVKIKMKLFVKLISGFYAYSTVYKNPNLIQLLRENYNPKIVENYIAHVDALKLDRRSCRIWWLIKKTTHLAFEVRPKIVRWQEIREN
jgi:glycosyltransferase involved in cell wall biosynthesis